MNNELPISEITYDDSLRQRKTLSEVEALADSIKRLGLINPITVDKSGKLLAGRRRLEAVKQLGWETVPIRYFENLDEREQRLLELDENLRRVDLSWEEQCFAIADIYTLTQFDTYAKLAEYAGLSISTIVAAIPAAKALRAGDERIKQCKSLKQAGELIQRRRNLAIETELARTHEGPSLPRQPTVIQVAGVGGVVVETMDQSTGTSPFQIMQGDFLHWAPSYEGPKFNFLHCDFPYGINFDKSDAARSEQHDTGYADDQELFWSLTDSLFQNLPRFTYSSAHILFWFSLKYYTELLDKLSSVEGLWVNPTPLIWHKSCGSGIAADYKRRPKHVYETALWMSVGDRQISRVVNDLYSCPIAKEQEGHLSAKPEPMLRHFMSMGVNDLSEVFDPTCGSGTSLRAAASLGATRCLGLELNSDLAEQSDLKLQRAIKMSQLSEKASELV